MKKQNKLSNPLKREQISEKLLIPKDVFAGSSMMSLSGDSELYIENYKGIVEYLNERITIQGKHKRIVISGKNLVIQYYSGSECSITGKISTIQFFD